MRKLVGTDGCIQVTTEKSEVHVSRVPKSKPSDDGRRGQYLIPIMITASKDAVYIPISAASGRQSTGFVYQLEGTMKGKASATVKVRGEDAVITSGSILYAKIGRGKTAIFKVLVEVVGALNREYRIVVGRINYKLNTNDTRYKRMFVEIGTKMVRFK